MSQALPYIAAPFTGGMSLLGAKPIQKALGRSMTGPSPPEAPGAISTETTAVQQATAESARRRGRARGNRSTILSQSFLSPDSPALQQTLGS